ncbi:hypothetical protein CBR_g6560 [Chara braunii]|uniref:Uncharacterized protein n=1 Tax=Chara braunii TaxID=69332 RepID=A0A388KK48_CHABU|nr:hypothetical protein CBR_g6560 [Chara braunii]|eukprot:GBG70432.1 hypothetical protein CBR_g6560 [Chara braunii]
MQQRGEEERRLEMGEGRRGVTEGDEEPGKARRRWRTGRRKGDAEEVEVEVETAELANWDGERHNRGGGGGVAPCTNFAAGVAAAGPLAYL